MNKKTITLITIGLLVLISLSFLVRPKNNPTEINKSADKVVESVESKIGNESSITVPENIKQITPDDWERYQNVNCSNESMETICEYYIQTKNETGEKSTKNLEWNSFCAYVKKYKGEDSFDTGSYHYETLGYETASCHQGMYQNIFLHK